MRLRVETTRRTVFTTSMERQSRLQAFLEKRKYKTSKWEMMKQSFMTCQEHCAENPMDSIKWELGFPHRTVKGGASPDRKGTAGY